MAIKSYKSIGKGVFGINNAEQFGMLISSITTTSTGEKEDIKDENSIVIGHLMYGDNVSIKIDGYIITDLLLPSRGDILNLSSLGVKIRSYTESKLLDKVLVTEVEETSSNSDYKQFSISAIYFPGVDYSIEGIPQPPPPQIPLPEYYLTDLNDIINVYMPTTPVAYMQATTKQVNYKTTAERTGSEFVRWTQDATYKGIYEINLDLPNMINTVSPIINYAVATGWNMDDGYLTVNIDAPKLVTFQRLMSRDNYTTKNNMIKVVNVNTPSATLLNNTFNELGGLITVTGDFSNVTSLSYTFIGCTSLVNLPTSYPSLISGVGAFNNCTSLSSDTITAIITSLKTFTDGAIHRIGFTNVALTDDNKQMLIDKGWTLE